MGISQYHLLIFVLYSLLVGAALGVVYDFFRILRISTEISPKLRAKLNLKTRKKRTEFFKCAVIFIQDILFWLICSVAVTVFIYHVNNGRIRGIALICSLAGFFIYYNTIGRLVIYIAEYIILFIQMAIRAIYLITVKPLFGFTRLICRLIYNLYCKTSKKIYTEQRIKYLLKYSARGFK